MMVKFYLDIQKISPLEKESLLECHFISPAFLDIDKPAGFFIVDKGNISIMINEEDHLRIQALSYGLNLANISSEVFDLEEKIGEDLAYAFNETYGYLTSCPTNLGSGLRASVLLHLPALVFTNEVEKVLKGAVQIGMAVRGAIVVVAGFALAPFLGWSVGTLLLPLVSFLLAFLGVEAVVLLVSPSVSVRL